MVKPNMPIRLRGAVITLGCTDKNADLLKSEVCFLILGGSNLVIWRKYSYQRLRKTERQAESRKEASTKMDIEMANKIEANISIVARKIAKGGKNIVFMGADISTESGIADFRSKGCIWDKYRPIYFDEFMLSKKVRIEQEGNFRNRITP